MIEIIGGPRDGGLVEDVGEVYREQVPLGPLEYHRGAKIPREVPIEWRHYDRVQRRTGDGPIMTVYLLRDLDLWEKRK